MGRVIRHAACTALGMVLIIRLGWGSLAKALTPMIRPLSTSTSYMPQCEPVWTRVVPLTVLIGVAPHVKTLLIEASSWDALASKTGGSRAPNCYGKLAIARAA